MMAAALYYNANCHVLESKEYHSAILSFSNWFMSYLVVKLENADVTELRITTLI